MDDLSNKSEGAGIGKPPGGGTQRGSRDSDGGALADAGDYTRRTARSLRDLLARYIRRHRPPAPPEEADREPPPDKAPAGRFKGLFLLRMVPVLLAVVFLFSFIWDFPGRSFEVLGMTFVLEGLLRILSVSGLIGFLTNWVAIAMLFHPRSKRPLIPQGLIAAQRERVIYRLSQAVSDELINEQLIKQKIEESGFIPRYRELILSVSRDVVEDPEFRQELKALTSDYVENVLGSEEMRRRIVSFTVEKMEAYTRESFSGLALRAYRYFNEADFQRRIEQAVRDLPTSVDPLLDSMDDMLDRLPSKIEAHSDELEEWASRLVLGFVEKIEVQRIVRENMAGYDEKQLEDLLKRTTNEQLNYIKYLGAVLGVGGGLVIWEPLPALVCFTAIGASLFAVDEALYRRQLRG